MLFLLDPCGIICVVLTHAIVLYSDYVVVLQVIHPVLKNGVWAVLNTIGFNIIVFLLAFSHLCAVFSDPGIVPNLRPFDPKEPHQRPNGWTVCTRCCMYRPPRAHHCRVCRRCVRRMDHHCPWINNCVGELNQKYFILFLVYVGILCIYALLLVIVCRAMIPAQSSPEGVVETDAVVVAHTVVLVAICCLFGLFVLAILSDQYKSIVDDLTAVEMVQQRTYPDPESGQSHAPRRLTKRAFLREVFGSGPAYLWLLPCHHLFGNISPASSRSATSQSVPLLLPRTTNYALKNSDSSGSLTSSNNSQTTQISAELDAGNSTGPRAGQIPDENRQSIIAGIV